MHCPIKRTHFEGLVFDVCDDVYEPAEDSFLFAENLEVLAGEEVLDVGTGCGILGVVAAKNASHVVALDLNPYAIRCAKQNAKLNHVGGKIDFIQGDLFAALRANAKFDLIIFNAPYLPSEEGEAESWIGRSWAGGSSGREVVDRFIYEVPPYMKGDGRILLMQSTLTGVEETMRKFSEQRLRASLKTQQALPFFETLTLIEAKR